MGSINLPPVQPYQQPRSALDIFREMQQTQQQGVMGQQQIQMGHIQLQQAQQGQKDSLAITRAVNEANGDPDKASKLALQYGASAPAISKYQDGIAQERQRRTQATKEENDLENSLMENRRGAIKPLVDLANQAPQKTQNQPQPGNPGNALNTLAMLQQMSQGGGQSSGETVNGIQPAQQGAPQQSGQQSGQQQGLDPNDPLAGKKQEVWAQQRQRIIANYQRYGYQSAAAAAQQLPEQHPGDQFILGLNASLATGHTLTQEANERLSHMTPEKMAMDSYINQGMSPEEAYAKVNEDKQDTKPGNKPLPDPQISFMNRQLAARYQVLNPGQPLPQEFTVQKGATRQDYLDVDKALENVERARGIKANQDAAGAARTAAENDRIDKGGIKPVIGFDKNGHQVFTNYGNSKNLGLSEVREVGQAEAEKVTNARGLLPVFDSKDPNTPGILQVIDTLEKKGKLGPLASRWNEFLDGRYGKGDQDFESLRTLMGLAQTGLMQVHVGARGSAALLEHFKDLVDSGKMDAGTLKAGVQTELGYIKGKAMLPNGGTGGGSGNIPPAPRGMINVQIPGHPPGQIPASARAKFLQENPGAQVIQ